MPGRKLFWFLIILEVFSFQIAFAAEFAPNPETVFNRGDFQAYYEAAYDLYQTSGLQQYFQKRALLWSESGKRRNDLVRQIPPPQTAKLQQLQTQLLRLLELNPQDPSCLLWAGDYHYFYHQRQTAFWYYQQAQKAAPESETVNLALADFYLNEYQPEQAKKVLLNFKSPRVYLRMGAACLQSAEYVMALGYLIQADPLPPELRITRDKDLCKAYLALGEKNQADLYIKAEYFQPVIAGTIFRELEGWSAWLAGDNRTALVAWNTGKTSNADYKLWDSIIDWLRSDPITGTANATKNFHDPDLGSASKILQAQALLKENQLSPAYSAYLAAIQDDHRSLVGFLGASSVQLRQEDFSKALDLCNQGLAVNRNFEPLLAVKTEVLEKLGRFSEAAKERADLGTALAAAKEGTILQARLIRAKPGGSGIIIRGETSNLVGCWVSSDGVYWRWYPWWGTPLILTATLDKAWLVPAGPGLSGTAIYLEDGKDAAEPVQLSPTQLLDGQLLFQLPFKAKLAVEFMDGQHLRSYVADQLSMEHRIPVSYFPDGRTDLRIRWQAEDGLWDENEFTLNLQEPRTESQVQYTVNSESLVTNHRLIELNLSMNGGKNDFVKISYGESGMMTDWIPFQATVDYQLSAGDGLKTVIIQFADSNENIQEIRLNVELDTITPDIMLLGTNSTGPDKIQLRWSASEMATGWLSIFDDRGNWREIPAAADADGVFSGDISWQSTVFCRIAVKDKAGNTRITDIEDLNARLREKTPVEFRVNESKNAVNSRWITVRPVGDTAGISWAVSNDLLIWSSRQQVDSILRWRINPGNGEQLVYIKYKRSDGLHYQVVPVFLNEIPPDFTNSSKL